ncbi:potassium channel family protein [Desulfocurvibacter africanus]|uniref:potassium channel family protein n=1 Tax=Desulfocurvibacter africanus TaxID=873 RepID=UPI000405EAE1|nr:NAD-binding protein [Desulfocurvibacter africanus]
MASLRIMLVGGGKPVYFLARSFISKGHGVTIVNSDQEECAWLARKLKALVVHGDATQPRLLADAGVQDVDVILAATLRDEDNLAICQSAAKQFGVRRTLALVNDPELEAVFHDLGVTDAFSMTQVLTGLIERRVETEGVLNLLPLGGGKVNLTEIVLDEDAPVVGKTLMDVRMPEDSLVACIFREGNPLVPRGSTMLLARDRLVILSLPENYGQILRMLTGEKG